MKYLPWLCCVVALAASQLHADDKPAPLALKDGDRVVFVGNDFFDRDVQTSYIETALTLRYPKANITFRNLGYSGDTVWADARTLCSGWDLFGPEDQGFQRLKKLVAEIKPTVILVAYGMNESFAGKAGIDHFNDGLNRMIDMLKLTEARIALISPIAHENLGAPFPDPAPHNADLKLYVDAIEKVAKDRNAQFIDLYTIAKPPMLLTSDGIHPTPAGYGFLASVIADKIDNPDLPQAKPGFGSNAPHYVVSIESNSYESFRALIVKKNVDFFHYWRPENDTYVFGYRNHEQGRNAPEVPKFLPLVEEDDKRIAAARAELADAHAPISGH